MNDPHDLCYCQAARRSARFLSRIYDRHLAPTGINVSQYSILSVIARNEGISIAALADEMVMERTTLVRALKPLQGAEFVFTEPSGKGRGLSLRLTRQGQEKVMSSKSLWSNAQREFETNFGKLRAGRLREDMRSTFAAEKEE